ncbi:MAG: aminomethyltransferase family protein [Gammaproteobacteria bacterium]
MRSHLEPGRNLPLRLDTAKTPFHPRTSDANTLNLWHQWKGVTVSEVYDDEELEYFALRNSCGVFDVSPLQKYRVSGPDAQAYLNRLVTRDISKLKEGRVTYVAWCNDAGKVLDDGTLFHIEPGVYRLCSYERHFSWLKASTLGFDVEVVEESNSVAGLAVQGPTSCAVLKDLGLQDIELMKPFELRWFQLNGVPLMCSRTGFIGDLGYELWIEPDHALMLWDTLFEAGRLRGIRPVGTQAYEMARIEAGFLQAGVDFLSAAYIVRQGRARSPFELGLDWLVNFDKPHFNGRQALLREQQQGSTWRLLKLDVEGNKPATHAYIYAGTSKQIGFVTSAVWSPICKANLALATVKQPFGQSTDDLHAEIYYQKELHWSRVMAPCTPVDGAFWNPARRRATPPADF